MKFTVVFLLLFLVYCYAGIRRLDTKDDVSLRLEAMTNIIVYGVVYFIDKNRTSIFNDTQVDNVKIICPYLNMEIVDIIWLPYPINIFINTTINKKKADIDKEWNSLSKKVNRLPVTEYNKFGGKILHIKNYIKDEWDNFILICLYQNSNYINLLKSTIEMIKEYHNNKKLFYKQFKKLLQDWYFSGRLDFILIVGNKKNLKQLKDNLKIKIIKESITTQKTPTTTLKTLQSSDSYEQLYEDKDEDNLLNIFDDVKFGGILVSLMCIFGLVSLCILNEYQFRKNKKKIKQLRDDQEKSTFV
ncbi:Hypothetical protein SRAE_2000267600 [Strongyloides ratti]|uniref:Uncharacterized protein n=1 Tax=Strongyloides ratti TaxID=34506 RepID=A0A090LKC9_STRRB|nr:Hypothetical protein SRAE_2000267600 [Strongyloides ratti]CEF68015.1 Hypothetical protein SRAE_2000267600 [Strongyloides ratti]